MSKSVPSEFKRTTKKFLLLSGRRWGLIPIRFLSTQCSSTPKVTITDLSPNRQRLSWDSSRSTQAKSGRETDLNMGRNKMFHQLVAACARDDNRWPAPSEASC